MSRYPVVAAIIRRIAETDQHGQVGLRDAANDRPQRLDSGTFADQPHAFGRLLDDLAVGLDQLLAVLDVLQGHRGVGGQFDEGLLVFLREGAGEFVDQFEYAEVLARPSLQSNAEERAGAIAGLLVNVMIDGLGLGGADRPARARPTARLCPTTPRSSATRSSPPLRPKAGRPTRQWWARSQRKMLARFALSKRVAASAIWTSSGSISRVWFHWLAICSSVSRRRIRRNCWSRHA